MIKAIITGATGMVGEGVLHECLQHAEVEAIVVINRTPCGVRHPKLKEIIHQNFHDISPVLSQLKDYNACYFCLGVTSLGKGEAEFTKLTYNLTLNFARSLSAINTDLTFCYISGVNTDSTEKGKVMWARVKGKTENDLMKLPFKDVYAFRPGYLHPTKGLTFTHSYYKYISWLFPLLKTVLPKHASTLKELGLAMINVVLKGYDSKFIEVKDIVALAKM